MFFITSWSKKKTVFVPGALVGLWPCAMLPNFIVIAFFMCHFSRDQWPMFHSWWWFHLFWDGFVKCSRVSAMF